VSDGGREKPKRFGRALRLSAKKRRLERIYDLAYMGGWPSWIARVAKPDLHSFIAFLCW